MCYQRGEPVGILIWTDGGIVNGIRFAAPVCTPGTQLHELRSSTIAFSKSIQSGTRIYTYVDIVKLDLIPSKAFPLTMTNHPHA